MSLNGHAVLVVIVFAGGPHTPARYQRMCGELAGLAPAAVYLTGADFGRMRKALGPIPAEFTVNGAAVPVFRDGARCTLQSCRLLGAHLRAARPPVDRVHVVTSNYHAARACWLLRPFLPRGCRLTVSATPDIKPGDWRRSRLARGLLLGECGSWLYSGPLGLLLRPAPTALGLLLSAAAIRLAARRAARSSSRRGTR